MMKEEQQRQGFLYDSATHGAAAAMLGLDTGCSDQVVGDILSGWRYDLSSVAPATRGDYEQHFVECFHCRARRRLHRTIDIVLMALFTASFVYLLFPFSCSCWQPQSSTAPPGDKPPSRACIHGI